MSETLVLGEPASRRLPAIEPHDPLAPTLFHQPWWLDIATKGRYGVVEATRDGRAVGRLPYCTGKRYGFAVSLMPTLTHFLGPAIDEGTGGANSRFLQRLTITQELLGQLPQVAYFKQKMHRGVTDVLAFQSAGYASSVQFTHEIAPQPEAAIWRGMRDKTRNMVRKASRDMVCETLDDPYEFVRIYRDNLAAKNADSEIDLETSRALISACLLRRRGRIYAARQKDGAIAAAIFCAWDQSSSYYLLSTRASDSGNSANTLILWEAIKDATSRGLIFDFDGVGSAGAVLFYAGFGPVVRPRYIASRSGKLAQLLQDARFMLGVEKPNFF